MGVPKFYRWISERYPCLSEVVREYQIPEFDNLYLDMNGIIHVCSHPNDEDPHFRISEEKIFKDIFQYIEILFRLIRPSKVFFMAVDGVAPRAKMNQQRGRRFRSAREAEEAEKRAIRKGEVLPTDERFDSNCITPGTAFMAKLHEHLKYFVSMKISTDKAWRGIRIYLSGHETPGEGEHKIMEFIRSEKAKPDYDSNTRHCLYGLDADLIMLGLCTHEPHFSLLREEVQFGGKKNQKRMVSAQETTFHLLHLSLMREYLDFEFSKLKGKLNFDYDLEKIIDDWVLMEFLVGNDFIPHLPQMHIAHDALPALYATYIEVLPTLDGYINEGGYLNLKRFEAYVKKVAQFDYKNFDEHYADLKWFRSKTGRRDNRDNKNVESTSKRKRKPTNAFSVLENVDDDDFQDDNSSDEGCYTDNQILDNCVAIEKLIDIDSPYEEDEQETFEMEFTQHKRDYYMNKLEYSTVTPEVLRDQAECYVRAIQWNLHYYYNGVCSWSWYYPHHYAPYISDIKDFSHLKLEFELGTPFFPFQQLLAVLPSASKKLLPFPFQSLMCTENSPLIEYYPLEFKTDLNGKLQDWEAVVLIPFIKENRLLEAMKPLESLLTAEEKNRNRHGPCLLYTYTDLQLPFYESPSSAFPNLELNHAVCQEILRNEFDVENSKLVKGLCPNVRLDVYFPGFPTLKHLSHTAELKKASVKVFQMHSRNENMLLHLRNKVSSDVHEVAKLVLGKIIFVNWPHLVEAKVIAVADCKTKISINESKHAPKQINEENISEDNAQIWRMQSNSIHEHYFGRLGIIIGETKIIIYACPLVGRKYIFSSSGRITLEKQWANLPVAYAYQATVKDITTHDPTFKQYKTLEDLFKPKTICFMLSGPYYGSTAEVVGVSRRQVTVSVSIMQEPNFDPIYKQQNKLSVNYMPGFTIAHRLGISSHLLSRMTGTFYIIPGSRGNVTSTNRVNVGLNLKFNKKNKEVPGFTKKTNDGWLYSLQSLEVMAEYLKLFPELFEFIATNTQENNCYSDDIFPSGNSAERVHEIQTWLKSLPCYNAQQQTCGTEVLEAPIIQAIEEAILKLKDKEPKYVMLQVKPTNLYLPCMHDKGSVPDSSTTTCYLYDRVVNVREDTAVPLGLRGTIVGIHSGESTSDVMYDIIFDDEFAGGSNLRCSSNKGYKMPTTCFINLNCGIHSHEQKQKHNHKVNDNVSTSTPGTSDGTEISIKKRSTAGGSRTAANFQLQSSQNINEQKHNLFKINHSPNSPFVPQMKLLEVEQVNKTTKISESSQPANEFMNMWAQLEMCTKSVQSKTTKSTSNSESISLSNAAKSLPQSVSLSSGISNTLNFNSSQEINQKRSSATENITAENIDTSEQTNQDQKPQSYDIDGSAKLMEILHIGNDVKSVKPLKPREHEYKDFKNSQRQKTNTTTSFQVSYPQRPLNSNRVFMQSAKELFHIVHYLYGVAPVCNYCPAPKNPNLVVAVFSLPDGANVSGNPCMTTDEAMDSAANAALGHLKSRLNPSLTMPVRPPPAINRPIGAPQFMPIPCSYPSRMPNIYPFGLYQPPIQGMVHPTENQHNYNFNAHTNPIANADNSMPFMPTCNAYHERQLPHPFSDNNSTNFVPTQVLHNRHHKKDLLHKQGSNVLPMNNFGGSSMQQVSPRGNQNFSSRQNETKTNEQKKRRSRVAANFDHRI